MHVFTEKGLAWTFLLLLVTATGTQLGLRMYAERVNQLGDRIAARRDGVNELQSLQMALERAEAGERGYVITGDEAHLDSYEEGVADVPKRLAEVTALAITGDEAERADLDALQGLIARKLADLRQVVELRRTQGFEAAAEAIRTGRGRELMEGIRQCLQDIIRTERGRLDASIAIYHSQRRWIGPAAIGALSLNLLLLTAGLLLLRRYMARRRASEASLQHIVEELEAARGGAESANRAKSVFLANMSHELRTPLTSIIGFAEMLAEDAAQDGQTHVTTDARHILSCARRLLVLVNDLLDISKIEVGRVTRIDEDVSIDQLMRDIVRSATPVVERNHNTFIVQVDPDIGWARFDAGKVRQVIENLLSNAAKFTSDGQVRLIARRPKPEELTVQVADTGIGIDAEQLKSLFQPFSKADTTITRRFGGTGLGLAISRSLARHLGGDVTVETTPGVGSTFTLHVPVVDLPENGEGDDSGLLPGNTIRQLSPR